MKVKLLIPTLIVSSTLASQAAVIWTTTFTGTGTATRTMVNTSTAPFTDTLAGTSSLTRSGSLAGPFITGTSNTFNNYNPRQNVDDAPGSFWQADFLFSGGASTIDFSAVSFDIYRYNNSGNMDPNVDIQNRSVNFTASYTITGGATWIPIGSTQNVNLTPSVISNPFITVNFDLASAVPIDLSTAGFGIRFRAQNDATNVGANVGINKFAVSAIPEPSSALVGALGLLALLRRRR